MNKEMNNDNIFIVSKKIKKNKKQKILIIEDDECEINENTKENLQILNKDYWENLYNEKYNKNKYKKNNKNFSKKISIGLVHPKGRDNHKEKALTKEFIEDLYNSPYEMSCMPYVVAGYLLGSQI
jgi:hypothetical protein